MGVPVVAIALIIAVSVVPAILDYLWLDKWVEFLPRIARRPILLIVVGRGIAMMYRYGSSRVRQKLRWVTWGATFSTSLWLVASVLFALYIVNFADYNATDGTLGMSIGLIAWTWISVIILILGAEIDAELKHQTSSIPRRVSRCRWEIAVHLLQTPSVYRPT